MHITKWHSTSSGKIVFEQKGHLKPEKVETCKQIMTIKPNNCTARVDYT